MPEREDKDLDAAPEGAPNEGRPDVQESDETLSEESSLADPSPEQQDQASGPAGD